MPSAPATRTAGCPLRPCVTRRRRGVVLMAGSDAAGPDAPIEPGASVLRELELLREAGLDAAALRRAAGPNLVDWLARAARR